MLGNVVARLDVGTSRVGQLLTPGQILSAVETTPVPVSSHDGANEVGIVLVRRVIVDEAAALDVVGRSSDCADRSERHELGEDLHGVDCCSGGPSTIWVS